MKELLNYIFKFGKIILSWTQKSGYIENDLYIFTLILQLKYENFFISYARRLGTINNRIDCCYFFGANRIPEIFRGFGKGIREFKEASKEIQKEIESDDSKDKK